METDLETDKNGLEEAKANIKKLMKELDKQNVELKKSEVGFPVVFLRSIVLSTHLLLVG